MADHLPIVAVLLIAALLHASWNAVTKGSRDPLLAVWMVTLTGGAFGAAVLPWVPVPPGEVRGFLFGSVIIHFAYQVLLAYAYRKGDLSHVYPIARGLSPLVVAVLAAAFASEPLNPRSAVGVIMVAAAIASLAFGSGAPRDGRSLGAALVIGLLISGYTFVDAKGIRASARPIDYIAWSFLLESIPITVTVLLLRRPELMSYLRRGAGWGIGGGIMATTAYALVLWAISVTPMAAVSALRETSVIFAALIGSYALGEPFGARRIAASCFVALGIVLIVA